MRSRRGPAIPLLLALVVVAVGCSQLTAEERELAAMTTSTTTTSTTTTSTTTTSTTTTSTTTTSTTTTMVIPSTIDVTMLACLDGFVLAKVEAARPTQNIIDLDAEFRYLLAGEVVATDTQPARLQPGDSEVLLVTYSAVPDGAMDWCEVVITLASGAANLLTTSAGRGDEESDFGSARIRRGDARVEIDRCTDVRIDATVSNGGDAPVFVLVRGYWTKGGYVADWEFVGVRVDANSSATVAVHGSFSSGAESCGIGLAGAWSEGP